MTIRLLHACGDDPKGAVLTVNERRAQRLLRTGYAEEVKHEPREEESQHGRAKSRSRV